MYIRLYLFTIAQFLSLNHLIGQITYVKNDFNLKGVFSKETKLKKVYLVYVNDDGVIVNDSSTVFKNTFTFNEKIRLPTKVFLFNNKKFELKENSFSTFFAEQGKMHITVNPETFNIINFIGSKSQEEYSELAKLKKDFFETQKTTSILIKKYFGEIKTISDSIQIQIVMKKIDSLQKIYEENEISEANINLMFASKNLNSYIVPEILSYTLERNNLYFREVDSIFSKVSYSVKNSNYGKNLNKTLTNLKKSAVGSRAPDFNLKDISGVKITLSNFKGKFLLIDFWASWCAPCLSEFPFIMELYEKNKDHGFEVLSISYHDEVSAWKNAIFKQKTDSWINVSIEENKSDIAENYFVTSIPMKVLIDKEGIIIGRWNGNSFENNKEIIRILKNKLFTK